MLQFGFKASRTEAQTTFVDFPQSLSGPIRETSPNCHGLFSVFMQELLAGSKVVNFRKASEVLWQSDNRGRVQQHAVVYPVSELCNFAR